MNSPKGDLSTISSKGVTIFVLLVFLASKMFHLVNLAIVVL